MAFIAILAGGLSMSFGCATERGLNAKENLPPGFTAIIDTKATVGLKNQHLSICFDKKTGELISLKNLVTGDNYLKCAPAGGNPWRAYVDTTELPPTLRHGFPYPVQPPPGALGGILVDPSDCRLVSHTFTHQHGAGILRLVSVHAATGLHFALTVRMPDNDVAATFALTIRNAGDKPRTMMAASTYFTGLGLGLKPQNNLGVFLFGMGHAGGKAWADIGGAYGRNWSSAWDAVYDRASDEALGVIVEDATLRNKMFKRFPGGGMAVIYFNKHHLAPGQEISYPAAHVLVYRGNWKPTARRYGKWFRSAFHVLKQPAWLDDVDMYKGPWIPSPKAVAEAKASGDLSGFTSFRKLPLLYLNNTYDLKEWAQYWQGVIIDHRYAAYAHTDGIYDFRQDLGGPEAFHFGTAAVHKLGRYVGLYVAAQTMRNDSRFFHKGYFGAGTTPQHWLLMQTPHEKLPPPISPGNQSFHMSIRFKPWQDYLADVIKTRMKQSGADYVRLDESGHTFVVDYNPAHHLSSPFAATPDCLRFYKKVRTAMDQVNPQSVLFTEIPTDLDSLYCNGALVEWSSGTDIAPLKLVVPSYLGLSYNAGQIECALQGWVPSSHNACGNGGFSSPYFSKLWGPGFADKPPCYPKHGPGPKLHWDELGRTFYKAARHGNPTNQNPVGIGQNPQNWAGRLWRSQNYWLLVCGNLAAIRPKNLFRVRLPQLQADITSAYEFDFQTLKRRNAHLERTTDGIFVTLKDGFSAVLLPTPRCPAMVELQGLGDLKIGHPRQVRAKVFAPWRTGTQSPRVRIKLYGLVCKPQQVTLPVTFTMEAPAGTEPGYYKLEITGNILPLKRWIKVAP